MIVNYLVNNSSITYNCSATKVVNFIFKEIFFMTGQDIQDKLDEIVADLQTNGKGKTVEILLRAEDNTTIALPLSSDGAGVVDNNQLTAVQNFIDSLKPLADTYETELAPVKAASEIFRTAREVHQQLVDEASAARTALTDALDADQDYQDAKTAYDTARQDAGYIAARNSYKTFNISENFGNLSDAKGKYIGG